MNSQAALIAQKKKEIEEKLALKQQQTSETRQNVEIKEEATASVATAPPQHVQRTTWVSRASGSTLSL